MTILVCPLSRVEEMVAALHRASPPARPNETWTRLADREMNREGRMTDAIAEMRRGLPWIEVGESEPFEMSSSFSRTEPW